ncbi:hypothetical protein ENSA5_36060 [Enhygromyxa salina]|uniref:Uncharacterized protein n=1 Tax=Enhygromyxa salina TaxID=215803 RepID=A0A2S9XUW6_9BACT|nr:hypothetical protein [Enhygromyxa salina]PRP96530.1 hypothetical protein ENSA5_36060 [Enhygromyxa salina]
MLDRDARVALAAGFFAGDNQITWSMIERGTFEPGVARALEPWLNRLIDGDDPVFLPYKAANVTVWYAASYTNRGFRHLQEALTAFVGPSYSNYVGQPTRLDASAPSQRALIQAFGPRVIRFEVKDEYRKFVHARLIQFVELRGLTPSRSENVARPTGRILSDFDEALRLGALDIARVCIEELESGGHLDAQNILYLRICLNEASLNWQDILDAEARYCMISAARRPRLVSQALLRAVYVSRLAGYQAGEDPEGALAQFRSSVVSEIGPLLTTRAIYDCPEADVMFTLLGIVEGHGADCLRGSLAVIEEDSQWRAWIEQLLALAEPGPGPSAGAPSDPLGRARGLQSSGTLDAAWTLLLSLPDSPEVVLELLRCACDISTLACARVALDRFDDLTPEDRVSLASRRTIAGYLRQLRELLPDDSSYQRLRERFDGAKRCVRDQPEITLADCNQIVEQLVLDAYRRHVGPLPPRRQPDELLISAHFRQHSSGRVVRLMRGVLELGGHSDPDDLPSPRDVERVVEDVEELLEHYAPQYWHAAPEPSEGSLTSADAPGATTPAIPSSWLQWVEAVKDNQEWMDAAVVAKRGSFEWSSEAFESEASALALSTSLGSLTPPGETRIREGLPYLLVGLSACRRPARALVDALELLVVIHLSDPAPGRLFFATLANLVELMLSVGVTAKQYAELVREAMVSVDAHGAPAEFDGCLELLDVLVSNKPLVPQTRTQLAMMVMELMCRHSRRVSVEQRLLLAALLSELELSIPEQFRPASDPINPEPLSALRGKHVALYSLKQTVLHRISSLLRAAVKEIRVSTFDDHVGGSVALRAAARSADVFVIATAAAKHAATNFIESERGDHGVTLKPAGQGSSSMLRTLVSYCTEHDQLLNSTMT